jgi:NAD(P)-dependent dehydrogenase (short-subunit alcohol dehydrogenase family)
MTDLLDLSDKLILITGGAGAIGRVVVKVLAEHGASVAVNDLLPEAEARPHLAEAAATGANLAYFQADTTQPEAVESLFDQVEQALGLPDIVCCHAGIVEPGPIEQISPATFERHLNINLSAAFLVAQTAVRRWLKHDAPGHLIFTSSWVQDVPWPEITPYTTSKAGMKALARGFARELAAKKIRANLIAPGIVAVGMAKRQWDTEPDYRARASRAIPLGYMQPPETVAHAFLFLCSNMANYMTGSVLLVDGGCSLYPMD